MTDGYQLNYRTKDGEEHAEQFRYYHHLRARQLELERLGIRSQTIFSRKSNPTRAGYYWLALPDTAPIPVEVWGDPANFSILPPEGTTDFPYAMSEVPAGSMWAPAPIPDVFGVTA